MKPSRPFGTDLGILPRDEGQNSVALSRRLDQKEGWVGLFAFLFSMQALAMPIIQPIAPATAPATAPTTAPASVEPISEILFVGDSHSVGCFGIDLHTQLSTRVEKMTTSAICGSTSATWLDGHNPANCKGKGNLKCDPVCVLSEGGDGGSLKDLLGGSRNLRRATVIALGTNMLKGDQNQTMRDVGELIDQVKGVGSLCVWIGPPQAAEKFMSIRDYENFDLDLKDTVENMGCSYISSSDKTSREDIKDKLGVHYSCSKGKDWAGRVLTPLQELLKL